MTSTRAFMAKHSKVRFPYRMALLSFKFLDKEEAILLKTT